MLFMLKINENTLYVRVSQYEKRVQVQISRKKKGTPCVYDQHLHGTNIVPTAYYFF